MHHAMQAFIFFYSFYLVCCEDGVLVQLPEGRVKGSLEKSDAGNSFYSFYGIPYALPPTGKRRFMRPVPVERWDEVKGSEVVECAQEETGSESIFSWGTKLRGVEDCLVVNIYTPNVGEGDYPVMVFVHGGGYFAGHYIPVSVAILSSQFRIWITGYLWPGVLDGS